MTVFEYDGRLLIVDCGVLFPEEHHPGVDLILPDFESIRDRLDQVEALVLTHGHEDHIGATPYLLRERQRHPARRLQADPGAAALEAAGAPAQGDRPARGRRGRPDLVRPVRPRVRRGQPLDPRRAGGGDPHRAPAWCCTPATSRWTSCRSTAGSPTCARSPGSARRASTCSWSTPPTPRCPGFTTSEVRDRPGHRPGVPPQPGPDHRGLLRLPRAPGAAGARRRGRAQPQGRLRRPLDDPQHEHRPRARLPQRAGGHAGGQQGDRRLRRPSGPC